MSYFKLGNTGLYDVLEQIIMEYSHPLYLHVKEIIREEKHDILEPYQWYLKYLIDGTTSDINVIKISENCQRFACDKEYSILNDIVEHFPQLYNEGRHTFFRQTRNFDEVMKVVIYLSYFDPITRIVKDNLDLEELKYLISLT